MIPVSISSTGKKVSAALALALALSATEARVGSTDRGLGRVDYNSMHCNNVPNRNRCFEKPECFFQDGWCHVRPVDPEFGPLPDTAAPTASPTQAPRPATCAEEVDSRSCRTHYGCTWRRGECKDIDIDTDNLDCEQIERRDCDAQWECSWARRDGCIANGEMAEDHTCDELDDDLRDCARNAHCATIYWYNASEPSCVPIEIFPEIACEHLDQHTCRDAVAQCEWNGDACAYTADT